MEFVENVATAVDKKQHTVGVFIDLQKAFETIDPSLLLMKCDHYGLRGVVHLWLRSYLENRFQHVKMNDTESSLRRVICGVPQGSVLGPNSICFNYFCFVCLTKNK